jgi:hypothetical protein
MAEPLAAESVIAEHLPLAELFPLVMLVFKNNHVQGHFELGKFICGYIAAERAWKTLTIEPSQHVIDEGNGEIVAAVAISDMGAIALGFDNGVINIIKPDGAIYKIETDDTRIENLVFHPNSHILLVYNGTGRIIDTSLEPTVLFQTTANLPCFHVGFIRDWNTLLFVSDICVYMTDFLLAETKQLYICDDWDQHALECAIAPNLTNYCVVTREQYLRVCTVSPSTVTFRKAVISSSFGINIGDLGPLTGCVYSADSSRIAVSASRKVAVYDASNGNMQFCYTFADSIFCGDMFFINSLVVICDGPLLHIVDECYDHTEHILATWDGFAFVCGAWCAEKKAMLLFVNTEITDEVYRIYGLWISKKRQTPRTFNDVC